MWWSYGNANWISPSFLTGCWHNIRPLGRPELLNSSRVSLIWVWTDLVWHNFPSSGGSVWGPVGGHLSSFFLMTGTNADKAQGGKQRRVKTPQTAKTHGEELRRRRGAPAGVCAQSHRPLIKEWFIEASQRELLGNPSTEWDFSSGWRRVNQTSRREACEAQR